LYKEQQFVTRGDAFTAMRLAERTLARAGLAVRLFNAKSVTKIYARIAFGTAFLSVAYSR
jgi:hypothetical protein